MYYITKQHEYMIRHWPLFEHPLEHHRLVILVLLYNDLVDMLCAMELHYSKQDIILSSLFSIDSKLYNITSILNTTTSTSALW